MKKMYVCLMLLVTMFASALLVPATAYAGSKGRRNTTIALGAVTAYGLLKKNRTVAIAGGLGTAYAYSRYRKSKKQEAAKDRYKRKHRKTWCKKHRRYEYR